VHAAAPPSSGHSHRAADAVFPGAGEMARLCRAMDWASTPLGPVEAWPQSLRTASGMVIAQGIAQNLCWGPELLQIYNDAYREVMGAKHPAGLGRSVLWSWVEIHDAIGPLFARVMAGETVYFEDLHLRIDRGGAPEDTYFTFSYSPVRVESGEVGGVLINCFEVTQQVRARALQAERDRLFGELQVERARLSYVFQHAPAFLAVLRGADHAFELANEAYYQLVGHRDILGKPVLEALPEIRGQGFVELLDGVLQRGEPFVGREVPVLLARTPGAVPEERFVDLSYLPLIEADGTRVGVIAHGTDVTEQVVARREVERLLLVSEAARADAERARADAEQANRAKADFLAAMSHELRTPLNAIGGYAELLTLGIHGPVTDAQRAALERVGAAQRHLLTLINDILAHARLEAGRVEFHPRPLRVAALLASLDAMVSPMADAKGIAYAVDACGEALGVVADEERARQILLNLVTNAIKYTAEGGRVSLDCRAVDDAGARWVDVAVRDDGRGIPADKLEAIFDPFMQVGRTLSRPEAGVGLGLAISRDLARGMGGDLRVRSVLGSGSIFTLRLPAHQDA
jgi:signal transduction histidine kinase